MGNFLLNFDCLLHFMMFGAWKKKNKKQQTVYQYSLLKTICKDL